MLDVCEAHRQILYYAWGVKENMIRSGCIKIEIIF